VGLTVGAIRVTALAEFEIFLELGGDSVSIPHRQSSRDFIWHKQSFRFVKLLSRLQREGKEDARFRGHGSSIMVDGYPPELESFVGALAAAQVLLRLCSPNTAAG